MNAFLRGLRLLYGVVKRLHNLVDCNCIAGIKTRKQLRWNFTKYDEMRPGCSLFRSSLDRFEMFAMFVPSNHWAKQRLCVHMSDISTLVYCLMLMFCLQISNSLAISTCVANRPPQASVSRMSIDNVHIISMYSIWWSWEQGDSLTCACCSRLRFAGWLEVECRRLKKNLFIRIAGNLFLYYAIYFCIICESNIHFSEIQTDIEKTNSKRKFAFSEVSCILLCVCSRVRACVCGCISIGQLKL